MSHALCITRNSSPFGLPRERTTAPHHTVQPPSQSTCSIHLDPPHIATATAMPAPIDARTPQHTRLAPTQSPPIMKKQMGAHLSRRCVVCGRKRGVLGRRDTKNSVRTHDCGTRLLPRPPSPRLKLSGHASTPKLTDHHTASAPPYSPYSRSNEPAGESERGVARSSSLHSAVVQTTQDFTRTCSLTDLGLTDSVANW
jgi:hypothetical protein